MAGKDWERILDVTSEESRVSQILDGDLTGVPMEVRECVEWVSELRRKTVTKTKLEVTEEPFKEFIKEVKESKSSLPSGRHYGHYKAIVTNEVLLKSIYSVIEVALKGG